MLIDPFSVHWLDELEESAARAACSGNNIHILIDGAFVPEVHKIISDNSKRIIFAELAGCSEEAFQFSPFLVQFATGDRRIKMLLQKCDGWPMVSVVETPESLEALTVRLSRWCIIEVDSQFFNFRFSDTRRLPAIFNTLTFVQQCCIAGPAVRWGFINREGKWAELKVSGYACSIIVQPELNMVQFEKLISESHADELMSLLNNRGCDVFAHASDSHAVITAALKSFDDAKADSATVDIVGLCESYWVQSKAKNIARN
jgi:hypothetical protein